MKGGESTGYRCRRVTPKALGGLTRLSDSRSSFDPDAADTSTQSALPLFCRRETRGRAVPWMWSRHRRGRFGLVFATRIWFRPHESGRDFMRTTFITLFALAIVTFQVPVASAATDDFTFEYFPHDDIATEFHNDWGAGRSGGRRHQGTDIFSEKLTPVVAVADGFVQRVRESSRPGWYIWIRHADGYSSWYMHLNDDVPGTDNGRGGEEFAIAEGVEKGAFVQAGQVIGWVGDSGNAEHTRPHTHFELHRDGSAINPYPYLDEAWQRQMREMELRATLD